MIGTIFLMAFAGYGVCTLLLKIAEAIGGKKAAKDREAELRKYCFSRYPDPRGYLSERITFAERLYRYITTGELKPNEKEDQQ